jgi:hypothetical protein
MQTSGTINFILPFLKLDTIDDLFQWILSQYSAGYIKRAKAFYSALTLDEKIKPLTGMMFPCIMKFWTMAM